MSFRLPDSVAAGELPTFESSIRVTGELVELSTAEPTTALHRLTGWAVERGVELDDLTVERPSLEDVYLQLTSPGLDTTTT